MRRQLGFVLHCNLELVWHRGKAEFFIFYFWLSCYIESNLCEIRFAGKLHQRNFALDTPKFFFLGDFWISCKIAFKS